MKESYRKGVANRLARDHCRISIADGRLEKQGIFPLCGLPGIDDARPGVLEIFCISGDQGQIVRKRGCRNQ